MHASTQIAVAATILLTGQSVDAQIGTTEPQTSRPTTTRPAQQKASAAEIQRLAKGRWVWANKKVVLLGIGDSVTDGYGAAKGRGYFDLLHDSRPLGRSRIGDLRSAHKNIRAINISVSGANSGQCLKLLQARRPFAGDLHGIVTMSIGGNDLIHWYGRTAPTRLAMFGATHKQAKPWIAAFRTRLDKILAEVERLLPAGCRVFLANIYDPTDGTGKIELGGLPRWPDGLKILAEYNRIIADAAARRRNVHMVDMRGLFLGHGLASTKAKTILARQKDPNYWYYSNLEDPNERGYAALYRLFYLEIGKVLGPR